MTTKVQIRNQQSQGNIWPAMLETLGQELGVSAAALAALGVGWAPVVPFKSKKNYQGWWTIPERKPDGTVVGLSLRSNSGMKVMYPSSKHGLVYPLNPDHKAGHEAYHSGAHNWVRTMEAGVSCPICDKPDGCLVSAEDPDDPQACVCIRERHGSEKPLKFGFLHILKDAGRLIQGAPVLPPSDYPVIVVEGMTDTAAAHDLGFVGVGRPSNLACMKDVADLVRGRPVIVVGENDDINPATGERAGHVGMIAAFQMIQRVSKDTTMVLPPDHFKDLRKWVAGAGLDRDQFLAYAAEHGRQKAEVNLVLADPKPKTAAVAFLDDKHRMAGRYLVKHWRDMWYAYGDGKYAAVSPAELEQPIYGWADNKKVQRVAANGETIMQDIICDNGFLNNLTRAMRSVTLITEERAPCWVNGATGPDPQDLIVFDNGLLHVPAYLEGKPESEYMLDPTPDLFTTTAMPFAFDPTAKCPRWRKFLLTTIGYEMANLDLLQEWFGYCLTSDTSLQKLLYMRGPSGAGKGVVCNVLASLCGGDQDQVASTSFTDLTGTFGAQPLVDKTLAIIPDARNTKNSDAMRGLELLLSIAAGDPIQIRRMYKTSLARLKLDCRIMIASNEFIDVPDNQGALARRLLLLEFNKTFVGQEDWNLEQKLLKEIPGIAVWALEGLRRLRKNGDFTRSASGIEAMKEWRLATSPMAGFLEECVEADESGELCRNEVYDAWTKWCQERNLPAGAKGRFIEMVRSHAPHARTDSYIEGTHKRNVFRGLRLKPWASRNLLGKP